MLAAVDMAATHLHHCCMVCPSHCSRASSACAAASCAPVAANCASRSASCALAAASCASLSASCMARSLQQSLLRFMHINCSCSHTSGGEPLRACRQQARGRMGNQLCQRVSRHLHSYHKLQHVLTGVHDMRESSRTDMIQKRLCSAQRLQQRPPSAY